MTTTVIFTLGQIFGLCSAVALILIGVFSEDQGAPHMTASSIFFELEFFVLILIGLALTLHNQSVKAVGVTGIFVALSSLIYSLIDGSLAEWYAVFASLAFVVLVAWNTLRRHHSSGL